MSEKKAYTQAFHTGKYDKAMGLLGKYDNVRRFWEDQVTAIFLRPALNDLVESKSKRLERVRVLDLGCGSGDGSDLIMGVTTKDPGIYEYITEAITEEMIRSDVAAGAPVTTDGRINLVYYAAWLVQQALRAPDGEGKRVEA